MKILLLLPRRELPSTRLRLREPSRFWEREGHLCQFVSLPSGPVERWSVLRQAAGSDVVILQKKTSLNRWDIAQLVQANPRIVFDYDDAVMFHELEHGELLSGKHFGKFLRTVRAARCVVAGNAFLARFASDSGCDVTVLPTPVDPARYRLRDPFDKRRDGPVVGWLGVSQNQRFLEMLRGVFPVLREKFPGMLLKIVSDKFPVDFGVPTERKPWSLVDEPADIASFDVGIMPLPDTLWSWGKCGYKLIQYLASGVPVVASPIGLNLDIVREGWNGYFAATHDEWLRKLTAILSSPEIAAQMGLRGREDVKARYALQPYAKAYLEVLGRAATSNGGKHG